MNPNSTKLIIGGLIFFAVITIFALCYLSMAVDRLIAKRNDQGQDDAAPSYISEKLLKRLAIAMVLLIALSPLAPYLLTLPHFKSLFDGTGGIGDTIGGLMNPIVGIAGVGITGLAFYIQYQANNIQRQQFNKDFAHRGKRERIEQFEAQFYEMVRFHRENVAEMRIVGYDFLDAPEVVTGDGVRVNTTKALKDKVEKVTEGRKVFVTMVTELEAILEIFRDGKALDSYTFNAAYYAFFSGLDRFKLNFGTEPVKIDDLEKARRRHETTVMGTGTWAVDNATRKSFKDARLDFNYRPFAGHASRLGHYFRHLFLTVKTVVETDVFEGTEEKQYNHKMKYLKILRAQLSNHEQILIFYNWIGQYGGPWEDGENKFFTEYCMIHNLWYDTLLKDAFLQEKIKELRGIKPRFRKGYMFELDLPGDYEIATETKEAAL